MEVLHYIWLGVLAVFQGRQLFSILGLGIPAAPVMMFFGLLTGVAVGATPGLAGPTAMAIALPLLISAFGFTPDALLPVFGFLLGIMKGATAGGAVPAILFNVPGTPDALMTTLDGHPMAKRGQARRALKIAQFSCVSGDTISDLVLFTCSPFLAAIIEAYLDLPEKAALLILSISFIAAVMGNSVGRGLLSVSLGLVAAFIGTGASLTPRLTLGINALSGGLSIIGPVIGMLVLGEIIKALEDLWRQRGNSEGEVVSYGNRKNDGLQKGDLRRILPYIGRSAVIGVVIGALPGLGSTLAAAMGYTLGRRQHERRRKDGDPHFGDGVPEGLASTEAASAAVTGAALIPVLSLGIPGNTAAVFLILAANTIGGLNPGPEVFHFSAPQVNPELVTAFGIFVLMSLGNILNWTIGGAFMRSMGILARIPGTILMPVVLLLTLTATYVQETSFFSMWMTMGFGILGYIFRRIEIPVLPFVIAFILAGSLENTAREAFQATGGDPWFLFHSATSTIFMIMSIGSVLFFSRKSMQVSSGP